MKRKGIVPQIVFFILMLICTVVVAFLAEGIYELAHPAEGESGAGAIGIPILFAIAIIPGILEEVFGIVSLSFSIKGITAKRYILSIITLIISVACIAFVPIFLIIL